jgi:hypothetical protein
VARKPASGPRLSPDAGGPAPRESADEMHAAITTYRHSDLVIEVRPGISHSAAWSAVTAAVPPPRRLAQRRRRRRRAGDGACSSARRPVAVRLDA